MSFRICLALTMILLSGCASVDHRPLTAEASAQLQGKRIVSTQYPMPDFAAFTAGKAAFAIAGAGAMIIEGNGIVRDNGIPDPATAISKALTDRLQAARKIALVSSQAVASSDEVSTLVATYTGADYLLDVKTLGWMFNYYPTDWAHYKVTYNARLRLIDTSSQKVVAETMCQTVQGDDANPPTKEQLLANRAALLKSYLDKGATACVDVLARDVLQL